MNESYVRNIMRFIDEEDLYNQMLQLIVNIACDDSELLFCSQEEPIAVDKATLDPQDVFNLSKMFKKLGLSKNDSSFKVTPLAYKTAQCIVSMN